jgi:hypothetical protein
MGASWDISVLVKLVDGLSTSAKLYHRRARGLDRAPSDELFAVVVLDSVASSRLNFFFKASAPVASPWGMEDLAREWDAAQPREP